MVTDAGNKEYVADIDIRREKVYIETSIISYLCARPSRDLIVAANQEITWEWWSLKRKEYDIYVSKYVVDEISAGDQNAAQKRLDLIYGIPVLDPNEKVIQLVESIMLKARLPNKVMADIAHIATATVHGLDYVLTLNCTHIANPHWQNMLMKIIMGMGYKMPCMCIPQSLLEGEQS